MKKIFIIIFAFLFALFISMVIFILMASQPVPDNADAIIDEILSREIPQQIFGDTARVQSGDWEIWYESIQPEGPPKGTILLIMGLGGNALEWPLYFVNPLVEAGYQVIRFDNRSTGLSSWKNEDFSLPDMAGDSFAVMDALGVESAHVIGLSLGGMIAQLMAMKQPERVLSLMPFMSSAYINDPELPGISRTKFLAMVATGIRFGINRTERNIARTTIGIRSIFVPKLSDLRIRALVEQSIYNQRYRKGFNAEAFVLQTQAVTESGSRYNGLKKLTVPTLVIHGREDPLIPVEHGIKTATVVPDAELLLIEGMGHDIGPEFMDQVHAAILEFYQEIRK